MHVKLTYSYATIISQISSLQSLQKKYSVILIGLKPLPPKLHMILELHYHLGTLRCPPWIMLPNPGFINNKGSFFSFLWYVRGRVRTDLMMYLTLNLTSNMIQEKTASF